jgi:hypothetical protein
VTLSEGQRRAPELGGRDERGTQSAVDDIRAEAANYHFYHNIEIVPGVITAGLDCADAYVNQVSSAPQRGLARLMSRISRRISSGTSLIYCRRTRISASSRPLERNKPVSADHGSARVSTIRH